MSVTAGKGSGIVIGQLQNVFSYFLATKEQKVQLEELANKYDEDNDGVLDQLEFELMKQELRDNDIALYKIFVAIPERYKHKPVATCLNALVIACVCIYHTVHYQQHPDHLNGHVNDTWSGPYPTCSALIYDSERRAQGRNSPM
jgi:hypothetical protein